MEKLKKLSKKELIDLVKKHSDNNQELLKSLIEANWKITSMECKIGELKNYLNNL